MHRRHLVGLGLAAAVSLSAAPQARAAILDFSAASGAATPLTLTLDGLSATFASPSDPGAFFVNPSIFATLGTTVLQSPGLGPVDLDVTFSTPVTDLQFAFATDDLFTDPTAITATFLNGTATIGSVTLTGTVQAGSGFPEGIIAYAGAPITGFTLSDPNAPGIAIGSLNVPEPPVAFALASALAGLGLVRRRGAAA